MKSSIHLVSNALAEKSNLLLPVICQKHLEQPEQVSQSFVKYVIHFHY